jgi:hypothetical protein
MCSARRGGHHQAFELGPHRVPAVDQDAVVQHQLRRRGPAAGNLKPAKDKSTERIDGIVALIMAIGRALVAKEQYVTTPMVVWV